MTEKNKAYKSIAMSLAFLNAAEMIRGHGEEGFSFEDEKLNNEYTKAVLLASKKISKMASKYIKIYNNIGVDIDTQESDNLIS